MFFKNLWSSQGSNNQKDLDYLQYTSSEKSLTPVNQLEIGMYVVELDRPWLETPFLFQGFELRTEAQIQTVKNYCNYVYIDKAKTRIVKRVVSSNTGNHQTKIIGNLDALVPPARIEGAFGQEIIRAESIYNNTEQLIAKFMTTAAKGQGVDGWAAKKAVSECVSSVLNSPDAMVWLTQLKSKDKYTLQHSLNVCILAVVFARYLDLSKEHIISLGLCGMLHDIGKMRIPTRLLNKRSQLENTELELLKTHTTLGYELLKLSDYLDSCVAETALTHHECLDGSGYPRGIKQGSISDFSKIIAIVDAYDSMTSNKIYQKGQTHLEAIHNLMTMAGHHWDKPLVIKFIECLGVYPPGSPVIMTNGSIGIVVEVNEQVRLRPKILLLLDEDKQAIQEEIVDLSQMVCDKNGVALTIKNIINASDWDIDPANYLSAIQLQTDSRLADNLK